MKNRTEDRALEFRQAHGDLETWDAVDFEVHENLALIALAARKSNPWARWTRRVLVLVAVAYAAVLYTVAELVHAARGEDWHRLEKHLDDVDDRLTKAEDACLAAGDHGFVTWLGDASDWFTDRVCALTARFLREPVR